MLVKKKNNQQAEQDESNWTGTSNLKYPKKYEMFHLGHKVCPFGYS